jgi:hypothetical protein
MMRVMKIVIILGASFGKTCKITGVQEKISWVVSVPRVQQNMYVILRTFLNCFPTNNFLNNLRDKHIH